MKRIIILMLMSVLAVHGAVAQTLSVSGTVTDSGGVPVIGAVVVVAGSSSNAAVKARRQ